MVEIEESCSSSRLWGIDSLTYAFKQRTTGSGSKERVLFLIEPPPVACPAS